MGPELSRRLAQVLGRHRPTLAERLAVIDAAERVETWEQLPAETKRLLAEVEARPPL